MKRTLVDRLSGSHPLPDGPNVNRQIENWGYVIALVLVGARGLMEMVHEIVGWLLTLQPHKHAIPWAFLAAVFCFVLPKWVGRYTTGKVWQSIGGGIGRLISRGRPAGPGDGDA